MRLRWKCAGTPPHVNKHDCPTEYRVKDKLLVAVKTAAHPTDNTAHRTTRGPQRPRHISTVTLCRARRWSGSDQPLLFRLICHTSGLEWGGPIYLLH